MGYLFNNTANFHGLSDGAWPDFCLGVKTCHDAKRRWNLRVGSHMVQYKHNYHSLRNIIVSIYHNNNHNNNSNSNNNNNYNNYNYNNYYYYNYTTQQLQPHNNYNYNYKTATATTIWLQLHYTNYITPQLQLHYATTTTTVAVHHTTSSSCGWGDHCNHCNHSSKHNSNHLSVNQWLRSAIPDSQQPVSPIGFLFLKLPPPPCAVLLVYG